MAPKKTAVAPKKAAVAPKATVAPKTATTRASKAPSAKPKANTTSTAGAPAKKPSVKDAAKPKGVAKPTAKGKPANKAAAVKPKGKPSSRSKHTIVDEDESDEIDEEEAERRKAEALAKEDATRAQAAADERERKRLMRMKKPELEGLCEERGIKESGKKADLMKLIMDHDKKLNKLAAACREQKINPVGSMTKLENRLEARRKRDQDDEKRRKAREEENHGGEDELANPVPAAPVPAPRFTKKKSKILDIKDDEQWFEDVQAHNLQAFQDGHAEENKKAKTTTPVPKERSMNTLFLDMVDHLVGMEDTPYNRDVLMADGGLGDHLRALAARHQLLMGKKGLAKSDRILSMGAAETSAREFTTLEQQVADHRHPRTTIYDVRAGRA